MTKLTLILLTISCAAAQDGPLRFDWDKLAAKATEKADISLEGPMLQMAGNFLGDKGEDAKVKQLVTGLKGVFVKHFEFDKDGQYSETDLKDIRAQLRSPEWSRIVDVQEKTQNVSVYLRSDGKLAQGLVVVAAEPRELTVVQILGPIDPSMLNSLGGKLGIPKMEFGPKKK